MGEGGGSMGAEGPTGNIAPRGVHETLKRGGCALGPLRPPSDVKGVAKLAGR
jgi:hypothetical protein